MEKNYIVILKNGHTFKVGKGAVDFFRKQLLQHEVRTDYIRWWLMEDLADIAVQISDISAIVAQEHLP